MKRKILLLSVILYTLIVGLTILVDVGLVLLGHYNVIHSEFGDYGKSLIIRYNPNFGANLFLILIAFAAFILATVAIKSLKPSKS